MINRTPHNMPQEDTEAAPAHAARLGSGAQHGHTSGWTWRLSAVQSSGLYRIGARGRNARTPAGFGDLVAKVKPAVISVRVKIDEDGDNSAVTQRDNGEQSGSPLDRFSKQFGFRIPNGMQRHQIVTGEGSGFFISARRLCRNQ